MTKKIILSIGIVFSLSQNLVGMDSAARWQQWEAEAHERDTKYNKQQEISAKNDLQYTIKTGYFNIAYSILFGLLTINSYSLRDKKYRLICTFLTGSSALYYLGSGIHNIFSTIQAMPVQSMPIQHYRVIGLFTRIKNKLF